MFHSLQPRVRIETKFVCRIQEQNPAVDFGSYIRSWHEATKASRTVDTGHALAFEGLSTRCTATEPVAPAARECRMDNSRWDDKP